MGESSVFSLTTSQQYEWVTQSLPSRRDAAGNGSKLSMPEFQKFCQQELKYILLITFILFEHSIPRQVYYNIIFENCRLMRGKKKKKKIQFQDMQDRQFLDTYFQILKISKPQFYNFKNGKISPAINYTTVTELYEIQILFEKTVCSVPIIEMLYQLCSLLALFFFLISMSSSNFTSSEKTQYLFYLKSPFILNHYLTFAKFLCEFFLTLNII